MPTTDVTNLDLTMDFDSDRNNSFQNSFRQNFFMSPEHNVDTGESIGPCHEIRSVFEAKQC